MPSRYVRFVVHIRHETTGHPVGVFQLRLHAYRLSLTPEVARRILQATAWFDEHLPAPDHLRRSERDAIFWFRREAREPLRRAHQLAAWLRTRGVPVETVQTDDPGEIVYQDRWQVAARPARHTYTGTA